MYWKFGPLALGVDLCTWGLGFMLAFRYPSGLLAHFGPCYLRVDAPDLGEWFTTKAEDFGWFINKQLCRLEEWAEKRGRKKGGK